MLLLEITITMDNVTLHHILIFLRLLCISTMVESIPKASQLFPMWVLPVEWLIPAICRLSIADWLQSLVRIDVLPTFSDVKSVVCSNNTARKRCQFYCSPNAALSVSWQYMRFFTSSSSYKRKLFDCMIFACFPFSSIYLSRFSILSIRMRFTKFFCFLKFLIKFLKLWIIFFTRR